MSMSHKNIPLPERRRLRQKMYKKHNLANILTHWFNVASWLMLLPTGIAIISSPRLGITPVWWQEAFRNLFGGSANLIQFHYTIGFIWIFVLLFNILVGFRKYFVPFAAHRMLLDKDDIEWMKIKPLQMLGLMKDKELPPQDAYNAGQKIYRYFVILGTIGIMISGPVMIFNRPVPAHPQADRPTDPFGLRLCDRRLAVHPCLHGSGLPRRERSLLLDVLRQGLGLVCPCPP